MEVEEEVRVVVVDVEEVEVKEEDKEKEDVEKAEEEVRVVVAEEVEEKVREVEVMDNEKSNKKKIAIFTCAGGSNTGQLANAVGVKLVKANFGYMVCLAGIAVGVENAFKKVSQADGVIAIDGCPKNCAKRILEKAGIEINQHYDLTKLGVKKIAGSIEFNPKEVETIERVISENLNSL